MDLNSFAFNSFGDHCTSTSCGRSQKDPLRHQYGSISSLNKILVRKPKGNTPFGRPKRRWEDNIRNWVGSCGLDACDSEYRPVEGSCEHGDEPSGSIKGGEFLH
jgi:hypothetical protein